MGSHRSRLQVGRKSSVLVFRDRSRSGSYRSRLHACLHARTVVGEKSSVPVSPGLVPVFRDRSRFSETDDFMPTDLLQTLSAPPNFIISYACLLVLTKHVTSKIEQDKGNNARSAAMKKKGSRYQRSTPSAPPRRPLVSRSELLRRPPGEEFRMGASAFKARMAPDAVEEDSDDSDNGSDDFNHDNSISEDKEPQKPPASCQLHPWASLTVPELKSYLEQWGLRVSGCKAQLVERLEDYQQSKNMEVGIITDRHVGGSKSNSNNKAKETTKKLARWQCSKAKAILVELHLDDNSPVHNKSAEELYALHKEFQLYPFHRFAENLKSLRATIKKERAIIASDERGFFTGSNLLPTKEKDLQRSPILGHSCC